MTEQGHRRASSAAVSMRLVDRFMVAAEVLRPLLLGAAAGAWDDRAVVERLASALWSVFSHDHGVIDAGSRHLHLGSWRAAAELIADIANGRYPQLDPPIRYADCYVGVLVGDEQRVAAGPLYGWIFSGLQEAGCDWVYSLRGGPGVTERCSQLREICEVLSRAYEENAGLYAPLPGIVGAYRDVYGRLPAGWPV
jgi:hypothetical protein